MKRKTKKDGKTIKGTPTAVLLSIVIHAVLFVLAGMFVVFTVVKQKEVEFTPPKAVERPKMKLKKPKVRVKKSTKPKPTTRIVTKVKKASMPDIQLPEMSGMAEGLGGGIGGFDMMPDLEDVTIFGNGQSIGNDFVGTFYDFKRDRSGRPIPMSWDNFLMALKNFVKSGWKPSSIARYYHSPKKLYATTFMMPAMLSTIAPSAFGEGDTLGYFWMAHYKGKLVCPAAYTNGITFRFRGVADDILVVRVDGRIVLSGCIKVGPVDFSRDIVPLWQSHSADSRKYNGFEVGDWITLEPGKPLDMEVMIGEVPGGAFSAELVVEVKGEKYERNIRGSPIFPIFKTAELSRDLHESIVSYLMEGLVNLTNGPVFSDYDTSGATVSQAAEAAGKSPAEPAPPEELDEHAMRSWTGTDGQTMEARFVTVIGDKAVLQDSRKRQRKIPLARLSGEDREFIELAQPPKFNIDFSKQSSQRMIGLSPETDPNWPVPRVLDYVFSATLKQTSAGEYNHKLTVEFFAIGEEVDGDNYILLDRQKSSFVPTKENRRSFSFRGDPVTLMVWRLWAGATQLRGEKYGGYLVTVTDERGKIVQYATPYNWIFDQLENLKKIPIGKHFNKECIRVFPPRPKREY